MGGERGSEPRACRSSRNASPPPPPPPSASLENGTKEARTRAKSARRDAAAQVPHDGSGDGGGLKFIIWAAGDTPWVCDALSLNCRRTHARTRSGPYTTLPAFFLLQIQISKAHFLILRALCPTMLMGQSILDVPCPSRHSSCVERHDEMSGQLSTTIASGAFSRCTPRARPPDPCSAASAPAESQKCTARARYDGRTDEATMQSPLSPRHFRRVRPVGSRRLERQSSFCRPRQASSLIPSTWRPT